MSFDRKAYMKEYTKIHYQKNKDLYKTRADAWHKENKERSRAIKREHTSRIRTSNLCKCCTRNELLLFYMNCPEGYVVDHIQRLSTGGIHCIKNLQYMLWGEHSRKSCYERYYG